MGNPLEPFSERVDVRAQNDCELIAKSTKRIQLLFQSKNLTWPEIQKFIKLPGLCSREAACSKVESHEVTALEIDWQSINRIGKSQET